ncbi:MAG: CHAT domain-containing protein [Caldilinea sp. CFX5]|nr:CHAT domain-containing protein [Caldilinea sp. CFX5]
MNYLDFDLAIEALPGTPGTYRARVLYSPAGQATVDFTLPFNAHELENYILKMGRPRRKMRSLTDEGKAAREVDARLYDAVFQGEVRDVLRGSLLKADDETGLRLRLRLGDAPDLLDLPWEYLYDPSLRRFFCHSVATPLVRYPEQPRPVTPLAVTLPLQVLVMIANPSDVSALDVEEEWHKIQDALAPLTAQGQVQLTRLPNATLSALQRQLRQGRYHIFHFVGHGGVSPINGERVLYLAVTQATFAEVFQTELGEVIMVDEQVHLFVFDENRKEIIQWLPPMNTAN